MNILLMTRSFRLTGQKNWGIELTTVEDIVRRQITSPCIHPHERNERPYKYKEFAIMKNGARVINAQEAELSMKKLLQKQ